MKKSQKVWIAVGGIVVIGLIVWRAYELKRGNTNGFTIGVAVAETGDAAEWGQGEYQVTKMLVDDFNARGGLDGVPINLDVEDTKTTGDGTVSAVTKLISIDQVPVILGPTWVDSYQGANPIAEQAKVVMLTPSAALEAVQNKASFTYLFSTFWPQIPEINAMDSYMVAHGIKTLAIVNDNDPFDTEFSDNLSAEAAKAGIAVVDREQFAVDANDFRTQILKMKQLKPDAIFVEINNVAGLGPFAKQVRTLGLTSSLFTTPDAQNQDAVGKFGSFMEGMTYPFPKTPSSTAYADFVREYQEKYKVLPSSPSAITTYNAVQALLEVLKEGARTGTEIRDALYKVKVLGFGTSEVSFNNLGEINVADFDMKMIHDSKFIIIDK